MEELESSIISAQQGSLEACHAFKQWAEEFLRNHLDVVSGNAQDALARVITIYREEIDLLAPPSFERKEVFFGPWSGKSITDWTPEVRKQEQELLLKAMEIETRAIEEIKEIQLPFV